MINVSSKITKESSTLKINASIDFEIILSCLLLSSIIKSLKEVFESAAGELLRQILSGLDDILLQEKEKGVDICRFIYRTLKTSIAEVSFRYRQAKKNGIYFSPLLELLGISRYQRITGDAMEVALLSTLYTSYRKALKISGCAFSLYTLWKSVQDEGRKLKIKQNQAIYYYSEGEPTIQSSEKDFAILMIDEMHPSGAGQFIAEVDTFFDTIDFNDRGDIVWMDAVNGIPEIFLYSDGKTQQVSTGSQYNLHPSLNERGEIAWSGYDGNGDSHIYLYSGGEVTRITTGNDNVVPLINNRGDIAYFSHDENNLDAYLYKDGASTKISTTPVNHFDEEENFNYAQQINDGGEVVWAGYDQGGVLQIYHYDGTSTTQITSGTHNKRYPRINNASHIIWQGYDGNDLEIYHYWNGVTARITNNATDDDWPTINNRGQVVWQGEEGEYTQVFLHDISKNTTNQVTTGPVNCVFPDISDNGKVLWLTRIWEGNTWYYDGLYTVDAATASLPVAITSLKNFDGERKARKAALSEKLSTPQNNISAPLKLESVNKNKGGSFTFLILGDSRGSDVSWIWGNTINSGFIQWFFDTAVDTYNPDMVFFNGDMSTLASGVIVQDHFKKWIELMGDAPQKTRVLTIKGNHENYKVIPGVISYRPEQERYQADFKDYVLTNGPEGYDGLSYSFTYNDAFFLIFDSFYMDSTWHVIGSGIGLGNVSDAHLQWITGQLASTEAQNAKCRIVITHTPFFSAEGVKTPDNLLTLWSQMENNGVELFFGAHEHLYARKKIDQSIFPRSTPGREIIQVIAGSGGAVGFDGDGKIKVDKGKWHINNTEWTFVVVNVTPAKISATTIPVTESGGNYTMGQPEDTFTIDL